MLDFFFVDYPGFFLLGLLMLSFCFTWDERWLYGELAWFSFFLYLVGLAVFGGKTLICN